MPEPLPLQRSSTFPTTHWTVVNALQQAPPEARQELLSEFLERYIPAFRLHLIHGRGITHEQDLEDTLQGFVTDKFVVKNVLDYVQEGRGRLRSYFRRCLDHYVYSNHNTAKASAWDGRVEWDEDHHAQHAEVGEPCSFDVGWARTVMCETIVRTKNQFFHGQRPHIWDVFDLRYLRPMFTGQPPTPTPELAERLKLTEKAVHNRRVTAIRAFGKHLREVIAEYVGDDAEAVEYEIVELNRIMRSRGFNQFDLSDTE